MLLWFSVQVNDIAFHPQHGTLATVGSDGKFSFWDKDARTKLKVWQKSKCLVLEIKIMENNYV